MKEHQINHLHVQKYLLNRIAPNKYVRISDIYIYNNVLIYCYVDSLEDKEYCILDIPHNKILVSE